MRPLRSPGPRALLATVLVFGAAGLAGSGCGSSSQPEATEVSPEEAYQLLINTPWLDHMPADETDLLHVFVFDREGFGGYVNGSLYRGSYDVFQFDESDDGKGGKLELTFLQDSAKAKTRYRVERMSRKGFDLRLTFSASPRGPKAYYGFDESRAVPEAIKARAAAALRATKAVQP